MLSSSKARRCSRKLWCCRCSDFATNFRPTSSTPLAPCHQTPPTATSNSPAARLIRSPLRSSPDCRRCRSSSIRPAAVAKLSVNSASRSSRRTLRFPRARAMLSVWARIVARPRSTSARTERRPSSSLVRVSLVTETETESTSTSSDRRSSSIAPARALRSRASSSTAVATASSRSAMMARAESDVASSARTRSSRMSKVSAVCCRLPGCSRMGASSSLGAMAGARRDTCEVLRPKRDSVSKAVVVVAIETMPTSQRLRAASSRGVTKNGVSAGRSSDDLRF